MSYIESKKTIDTIRSKYASAGDVIFKSALFCMIDYGRDTLLDQSLSINDFCNSKLDKAIIDGAVELCSINKNDLLAYINEELEMPGHLSYKRLVRLLQNLIVWMSDFCETSCVRDDLYNSDFTDNEIETLGLGFLLDTKEED